MDIIYPELGTMQEEWMWLCAENGYTTYIPACDLSLCYFLKRYGIIFVNVVNRFFNCNYLGYNPDHSVCCAKTVNIQTMISCHHMSLENFDYLESAPSSCEGKEKFWALTAEDLAAAVKVVSGWEADSIGLGQESTNAILDVSENFYDSKTASGFADALECGGKSDWFVPSKSELDLMYQNLASQEIGEFSDGYYWSSSYYLAGRAWNRPFSDGVSFDGKINNGANDDGSGTVAVLEIAKAFQKAKNEG